MAATHREILTDVAEGRLSPEEADRLLRETDQGARPEQDDETAEAVPEPSIARVRVAGTVRLARVIGDPAVREAVADGPHVARREGDTLVIESGLDVDEFGFRFLRRGGWPPPGSWPPGPHQLRRRGGDWARRLGMVAQPVTVRMNPDLPLDAEIAAGAIHIDSLRSPLQVEASAGTVKLRRVTGPFDIGVAAGNVNVNCLLSGGDSRIRCEAGSIRVHLERGSSVRVRARADFGKLRMPGEESEIRWATGMGGREAIIGDGAGRLDIDGAMGSIVVTADQ